MSLSPAERLAQLPAAEREAWLNSLTEPQRAALRYNWLQFWARPEQLPPVGKWRVWVPLVGRGWGKTRTASETVRHWVEQGGKKRIALVNDTDRDTRGVNVEGPDGIVAVCPPWDKPTYQPSKCQVVWWEGGTPNGEPASKSVRAVALLYSAEAPEQLRGPQHDGALCDELAKWKNLRKADPQGDTAWSNLLFGLRMGDNPQVIVPTTPRPVPTLKDLLRRPGVVVTRGRLADNRANVATDWYDDILARYSGTRLGRQEIDGELLEDTEGAMWTLLAIEATRVQAAPPLIRVVIGVDPPGSTAECGIIAAGLAGNGHVYILNDHSRAGKPEEWGAAIVAAYDQWQADAVVAETNFGGEMVAATVRAAAGNARLLGVRSTANINIRTVTATRGKQTRAEPVSALYGQNRVHHVGSFAAVEDQMSTWVPGLPSPDRMDALVWSVTDLLPMIAIEVPSPPPLIEADSMWGFGLDGGGPSASNFDRPAKFGGAVPNPITAGYYDVE